MAEAVVGCSCKDSSGFACTSQQTREYQEQAREERFRCWSDGIAHAKRNEKRAKNIFLPIHIKGGIDNSPFSLFSSREFPTPGSYPRNKRNRQEIDQIYFSVARP
jgi:hypothetical protein